MPVTEVFRARVREHPDRVAIVDGDRTLTYARLDAESDAVAAGLAARGVGKGDVVAVPLPRSAGLVVAALGVLKAGAAYSPLDPQWPAARIDAITGRLGHVFSSTVAAREDAPRPELTDEDLAIVVFTSGTTGEPKGVLVPHRSVVRLPSCSADIDYTTPPVMPLAAAVAWDAMVFELWGTILSGGTLVIVAERFLTPARLRDLVATHGVDSVLLSTSLFNMHVEEDIEAFQGIRRVFTGGEQLSGDHVFAFVARHPSAALVNLYGPAENGVFSTTHRFTAQDATHNRVPIGTPPRGTSVSLVDGEIVVGGEGLTHGYFADPEGTARRFVRMGGQRVYRTGDRGYQDADGLFYYAGRVDRQVKIRGHRIEPAEVERNAERISGVTRAVVVPLGDAPVTGMALFYTGTPGDVRSELATRLPSYLVPDVAQHVDAFPLTAGGKVDLTALADLVVAERPAAVPTSDMNADERSIAKVFADVLGRAAVPLDADFFALGGTSLAAGRLCGRLTAALGLPVTLLTIFDAPTVHGLAAWVAKARAVPPVHADEPVRSGDAVELLPAQLGFFVAHQMDPTEVTGLCPIVWDYTGVISAEPMRAAMADVTARHEALRSGYRMLDGPVAVPLDPPVELAIVDRAEDVLPTLIAPLDLANGRVWRAALAPDRFGIVVHHVALDGQATATLARDLSTAYRARIQGRAPEFGRPAPGLAELARVWATPADLREQRAYWRTALADAPELVFPAGPGPVGRLAATFRDVDERALAERVRGRGVTTTIAALAAFAYAVTELTGQTDVLVGVPVARREDEMTSDAVACMIEPLCLRLRTSRTDEVRAALVDALRHRDVPAHVVARLAKRRPLYRAVVSVPDTVEPVLDVPAAHTRHVWVDTDDLDTDLLVELLPHGRFRVSWRQEAVAAEFAEALADSIAGYLTTGVEAAR